MVKSALLSSAAVLAALAAAAPASAQDRWYVAGSLGGYFRQNDTVPDSFYLGGDPSTVAQGQEHIRFSDSALVGAAAIGYRLLPRLRVEAELGYDRTAPSSLHLRTTTPGFSELTAERFQRQAGDDYSRFTGEVNGFYDVATLFGRFTPYVGAGVGGSANHQSEGLFVNASGTPFTTHGGSSADGFAMAEGGVSIALTPRLSLVPAYRYVHYFQSNEDVASVAKLGLRFSF